MMLPASFPSGAAGLAPGTQLMAGIRPENVAISLTATGGLPAVVDLVEELGSARVAYCRLNARELAVVLPPGDERYEGRQVFLDFAAEALHLFDRTSGQRIDVLPPRASRPPSGCWPAPDPASPGYGMWLGHGWIATSIQVSIRRMAGLHSPAIPCLTYYHTAPRGLSCHIP